MQKKKTTPALSFLLYGLAIITLFTALWLFFSAFDFFRSAGPRMEAMLTAFSPDAGLLANLLNHAVSILGLVFAGLALTVSALLFTAAQLLTQTTTLSERLNTFELELQKLKRPEENG
jgi:hypothetical protein